MLAENFAWFPFLLTIGLLTVSPGADTVVVIRNTLRGGFVDGALTTIAICSGLFVHASVSALGVAALLLANPAAFVALQWCGAAYLVWLGLGNLRAATQRYAQLNMVSDSTALVWQRSLREGFLSNVLNPKTMAVYLAILPQFIDPESAWLQSMVLASLHFALSVAWLWVVAWLARKLKPLMNKESFRRWSDRVLGGSLIGLALVLVLT